MTPTLNTLLTELEQRGEDNDARVSERRRKYLNITRDTGEFLAVLVKAIRAERVLEIGTSNGYSTLWLASSLSDGGRVTTVECDDDKVGEAKANFERAGLADRIEQIKGDAVTYLQGNTATFDLVFLDADRSQYLDMADPIIDAVKPGGVLVCDNALSHAAEMADFITCLQGRPQFTTCLVPVGKGEFVAHKSRT
ncbi:O-methyltransferase family protein [Alloalcanivorax dieselolei B5]|uniref:O-methyltransferase family protein n=1 Tax=Alcanivorax dieselolei (strain DSM 16502 / CGMCC 1.3690 / MCCC 1A00001 / B-5) TaxID=930169 RepID=K0CJK2_ALCDB|nr:O-methyltransferase [Alloalcanivorax dieselolei]AFT72600.1 O-methyltransferase family protein [Alloalcanivorax dieselolei B5]GGJ79067.1 O-methyltransferase [Alloalcanivorax dieselolei]